MNDFNWSDLLNDYYQQQQAGSLLNQDPNIMGNMGNLDTTLPQGELTYPPPSGSVNPANPKKEDNPWGVAAMTIGKSLLGLLGKGGGGGPIGFAPAANVGNAYPFNMPKDIYPQKDAFKALLARYLSGGA